MTCSTACVPPPQGHPDFLQPSVSSGETLWPADVAEHSQAPVGSPGESSSAAEKKGSHGSGTKERRQREEADKTHV